MTNIYVGNLAYQVTEDDLRGAFTAFGQVSRVNVVKDRETGRSKGFGFVGLTLMKQRPREAQQYGS